MKIGFIGLGVMGKPMAKNILKAGYSLTVYDLCPEPCRELEELGAKIAKTPRQLAEEVDVVITMLPNAPNVMAALCGENGLLEGMRRGTVLIDMSSVSPDSTCKMAGILEEHGVEMLDAPVSGGQAKAKDGSLSIMVGGKKSVAERYMDVLRSMGSSVVLVGEIGAGNVAKLANQMIVACTLAAVSEAFQLARMYGVDENCVRDAIRGGMAGSAVVESKLPVMMRGNFQAGFRTDLQIKDLGNAIDAAKAADFVPELTCKVREMLQKMSERGYGNSDHSILYKYYEG